MSSVQCDFECPGEDREASLCSSPRDGAIRELERAKLRCLHKKLIAYIEKVHAMKNEACAQTDSSCFVEHIETLEKEIRNIYEKELERIRERHRLEKEQSSEVESRLEKRCSTLKSDCEKYEKTITSLEARCARLDAQNKHLEIEVKMHARKVEQKQNQVLVCKCQDDFENRMRQYKCMVESRYRQNLNELQIEIEKLSKEKTETTEKIRRLTSINEDYEGKLACLDIQMKELQEKIAEYSEELRKERMEKCLLKAEMGKKEELISSLRIEIRKLQCDNAKVEQAAIRQREELEEEIKKSASKLEEQRRLLIKKSTEMRICLDEPHLPEIDALKRLIAEEDAKLKCAMLKQTKGCYYKVQSPCKGRPFTKCPLNTETVPVLPKRANIGQGQATTIGACTNRPENGVGQDPIKPYVQSPFRDAPPCEGRQPTKSPLNLKPVPVVHDRVSSPANNRHGKLPTICVYDKRPENGDRQDPIKPYVQPPFRDAPPCEGRQPIKSPLNLKPVPVVHDRENNGQGQVTDVIGISNNRCGRGHILGASGTYPRLRVIRDQD